MKNALLKSVFGHDDFRPGQRELIDALQSSRDLLGVMATGSGKSLCYQFPAVESQKALPGGVSADQLDERPGEKARAGRRSGGGLA